MGQIVTVDFHGDELFGFEREGVIHVALKPIVTALGIDWSSQLHRLRRDPVLSEGVVVMTTPHGPEMVCLRLDLVNGWLFTIDASRVRGDAVREKVLVYQRECFAVLARHFQQATGAGLAPLAGPSTAEGRQLVTEARQTFGAQAARELWASLGLPMVPAMRAPAEQPDLFEPPARAA